jgi:hypothetical protein
LSITRTIQQYPDTWDFLYSTRHVKRTTSNFGDRVEVTNLMRSQRPQTQLI